MPSLRLRQSAHLLLDVSLTVPWRLPASLRRIRLPASGHDLLRIRRNANGEETLRRGYCVALRASQLLMPSVLRLDKCLCRRPTPHMRIQSIRMPRCLPGSLSITKTTICLAFALLHVTRGRPCLHSREYATGGLQIRRLN